MEVSLKTDVCATVVTSCSVFINFGFPMNEAEMGWRDGSEHKVLADQAWRSHCRSPDSYERIGKPDLVSACNTVSQGQADRLD